MLLCVRLSVWNPVRGRSNPHANSANVVAVFTRRLFHRSLRSIPAVPTADARAQFLCGMPRSCAKLA